MIELFQSARSQVAELGWRPGSANTETVLTRGQAVARIADRTASQQTLVISDCC